MITFRIGDYVGANQDAPVFGRVHKIKYRYQGHLLINTGYMIKGGDSEVTGPWKPDQVWLDPSYHVDYPHYPGTLYDCPACEVIMDPWDEEGEEHA